MPKNVVAYAPPIPLKLTMERNVSATTQKIEENTATNTVKLGGGPSNEQNQNTSANKNTSALGGATGNAQPCTFFLIPVGLRVVAIQHCDTGLYIAMDPKGKVYTSEMFTNECKFKEACAENYYVVYSCLGSKHPTKNRPMHIGINKNGRVTRGTRANKSRECCHFLPHPIEVVMMREPNSYEVVGGPSMKNTKTEMSASSSANVIGHGKSIKHKASETVGQAPTIPEIVTQ